MRRKPFIITHTPCFDKAIDNVNSPDNSYWQNYIEMVNADNVFSCLS